MKKVLITGENSYIGINVEKWIKSAVESYQVETLDMKNENWKSFDFSCVDVIVHVAGIAHVSTNKNLENLYFSVNRDLTIETAKIAKASGVKQFIFMSSMIVYNTNETCISKDTIPNPNNFYGQSKLEAEKGLLGLQSKSFRVSILRPPMIYGKNSKGNFLKLLKLAKASPFFPDFENRRSMLYIDNLCMFILYVIKEEKCGLLFPKNCDDLSTKDIVLDIRSFYSKKTILLKLLNPFIRFLSRYFVTVNKLFTDFYYDESLYSQSYDFQNQVSNKESIYEVLK